MEKGLKITKFQILLEVLCILSILSMFLYLFLNWSNIPVTIPIHYSSNSDITHYCSKMAILITPLINLGIYTFITIISAYPKSYNIPTKGTPSNKKKANAKTFILAVKLETLTLINYITFCISNMTNINSIISNFLIFFLFLTIIFYTFSINKTN